jgi:hypothetical protein
MNESIAHWLVTSGIGLIAFLLWTMFRDVKADVVALKSQNATQERELEGLKTTQGNHSNGFEDVKSELRALSGKVDQVLISMGRRPTPYGDGGRKT